MKRNIPIELTPPAAEKCKTIACATVIEEMLPLMPPSMQYDTLDFGLHIDPKSLKQSLQEAIDKADDSVKAIILGYGLCSQAVVGLKAKNCHLVVPRVDDCIALFLGSVSAYQHQIKKAPGTYYLTKGWIKAGDTPFDEYARLEKLYGAVRAQAILNQILKNYTRLALINTGQYRIDDYREHTRRLAEKFNLHYEEIPGSDSFIRAMLFGPWDDRFVVVPPNKSVSFFDFKKDRPEGD